MVFTTNMIYDAVYGLVHCAILPQRYEIQVTEANLWRHSLHQICRYLGIVTEHKYSRGYGF